MVSFYLKIDWYIIIFTYVLFGSRDISPGHLVSLISW